MKHLFLRAAAICSPLFAAALLAIPTHAVSIVVHAPTPVSTFTGAVTEYTASFTSASAMNGCTLYIDGVSKGSMTITGSLSGTAKRSATISTAGNHVVRATCTNSGGSTAFGEATVTVTADAVAPTLGSFALTPASPVAGSPVAVQINYDDTDFGSGLISCNLSVDFMDNTMSLSGGVGSTAGTANVTVTAASVGPHVLMTNCYDRSGNLGTHTQSVDFVAPPDTIDPVVSSILPTSAIQNVETAITANFSDNVGVTSCKLTIDGVGLGNMTMLSGTQASMPHTFTTVGDHTVYVQCADAVVNTGDKTVTMGVTAAVVVDTTSPVVSSITPSTATVGVAVITQATVSDNIAVSNCSLEINGVNQGGMTVAGTLATKAISFSIVGDNAVKVTCTDAAGNSANASRIITVTASGTTSPYAGRIVKLVCPAGSIDVNHPCKAVYYVGSDGKRHAFPNERVFFTWYSNFDGIIELSGTSLSGITLGGNVNYRPGVKMVKFTTLNKVYAVGRYGSLRWVTTEAIARSLYGTSWNTRIDDISDAFFMDYTFGSDITPSASFSPSAETSGVSTIDANLR